MRAKVCSFRDTIFVYKLKFSKIAGDIHIWERDTAILLHYVRPQPFGGDLTCIAWNYSTDDPFMLATGSHDGTVRIWTTPAGDRVSDDASYIEGRTDAGVSFSDHSVSASSSILGPVPTLGPSRRVREKAPTIRTTFSQGSMPLDSFKS